MRGANAGFPRHCGPRAKTISPRSRNESDTVNRFFQQAARIVAQIDDVALQLVADLVLQVGDFLLQALGGLLIEGGDADIGDVVGFDAGADRAGRGYCRASG